MKPQVYEQRLATTQQPVAILHNDPSFRTQLTQCVVFMLLIFGAIALNFGAAVLTGIVWSWLQ